MNDLSSSALFSTHTFDELDVGQSSSIERLVTDEDIKNYAATSGDFNPAHMDPEYAAKGIFGQVVIHGMWTAGLFSAVIGTQLPGPGTIYLGQDLRFKRPVAPGDTITATVVVREKRPDKRIVILDTTCTNQRGEVVLMGEATVIAPAERVEFSVTPRMV